MLMLILVKITELIRQMYLSDITVAPIYQALLCAKQLSCIPTTVSTHPHFLDNKLRWINLPKVTLSVSSRVGIWAQPDSRALVPNHYPKQPLSLWELYKAKRVYKRPRDATIHNELWHCSWTKWHNAKQYWKRYSNVSLSSGKLSFCLLS